MWILEHTFKVKIGGNYYINTPRLIVAGGESLFTIKRRDQDGLLAVDFDVYRSDGTKVATIRNAHLVSGNQLDYDFHKEPHHYWVVEKCSGRVICDVRQVSKAAGDSEIDVSVDLFTKSGFHIIAGPEQTNVGGLVVRNCTFENCDAGLAVE